MISLMGVGVRVRVRARVLCLLVEYRPELLRLLLRLLLSLLLLLSLQPSRVQSGRLGTQQGHKPSVSSKLHP
jgi:hypothetical protein